MAHHDRSNRERDIALAHGYRNTRGMVKLEGSEERDYGAYPIQLRMLR